MCFSPSTKVPTKLKYDTPVYLLYVFILIYRTTEIKKNTDPLSIFSPLPKLSQSQTPTNSQLSENEDDILHTNFDFLDEPENGEEDDEDENKNNTVPDAILHYTSPKPPLYNCLDFDPYIFIKNLPPYEEVVKNKLPVVIPEMIIQKTNVDGINNPNTGNEIIKDHTLILDLDETLVHCSIEKIKNYDMKFSVNYNGLDYEVYVKMRPHLKHFIDTVSKYFEVIVFTASQKVYAEKFLNSLDSKREKIKYRLYRDSCICVDGNYIKDLNVLGRDLNKCVIIDNSPHAFGYQVDNGIPIESWFDDEKDTELLRIIPFLISLSKCEDVKKEIRKRYRLYELIK